MVANEPDVRDWFFASPQPLIWRSVILFLAFSYRLQEHRRLLIQRTLGTGITLGDLLKRPPDPPPENQ
jgi:hypothetical protein